MAGLFSKLSVYLFPVGVYVITTTCVAIIGGEFAPLRQVALRQTGTTPLLYGRAYRDNYFAFKLISTQVKRPAVLILGSSRVMQFRSMFFNKKPSAFYNAGGAVQSVYEIQQFLSHLGEAETPDVVILGLDQPWFNAKSASRFSTRRIADQVDEEKIVPFARALNVSRFVFQDLVKGKIGVDALLVHKDPVYGVQALGIAAIVKGRGFRNDGSYQYGDQVLQPISSHERLAEGIQRLQEDIGHFAGGDQVAESSMAELEDVLKECRKRSIFVIGFSPPYAPSIYAGMMEKGTHAYLLDMSSRLSTLFEEYGFSYLDFSDGTLANAVDADMLDSFHSSELISLQIYMRMLQKRPDILDQYSDPEFLEGRIIEAPANRFEFFRNQLE